MALTEVVSNNIIKKLINSEDYRIEIITILDAEFLQYTVNFFKRVVEAKLRNKDITLDWYRKEFLDESLSSDEIAINAGLNKKTISNMYNTTRREIVLESSYDHYEELYQSIKTLVDNEDSINITLTLKFKGVSVDLNINESLIVINSIAVKRSALRGGLWSMAGKTVEKPLMLTLCKIFDVSHENYIVKMKNKANDKVSFVREIDFYLLNNRAKHKCEVKLMGKGNPESADAVIARDSKVFVADKLSDTNKKQLDSLKIEWVEMRNKNGYKKFKRVLENLGIPHTDFNGDVNKKLENIFKELSCM